jgi:hypothetical protein
MRGIDTTTTMMAMLMSASSAMAQGGNKAANWQNIEADNGAAYKIDLNSISHYNNGTADVVVYAVEGPGYNPENMRRLWFDCKGRYKDLTVSVTAPTQYAPPRSIAGKLSEIACAGAKDKRFQQATQPQPKDTPDQYCTGFSREACARIVAGVETKPKPAFCKPGFALADSGLSLESVRICQVISNEENRLKEISKNAVVEPKPQSRNYDLALSATRSSFPNIVGKTNLPDGTKLLVSINKPRLPNAKELLAAGLAMCEENCLPASGPKGETLGVATTVLAGAFSAGPFSWAGKPFRQDIFEVEIYLVSFPGENDQDINRQFDRMKKPIQTMSVAISPQ